MSEIKIARAPFGAETIHRGVAAIERAFADFGRAWTESETRRQLIALPPRLRADIGVLDAARSVLDLDETARSLSAGRR